LLKLLFSTNLLATRRCKVFRQPLASFTIQSIAALIPLTLLKIMTEELKQFQFPDKVPAHKKPAIKPDYW